MKHLWTIPNLLSISRIVFLPILYLFIFLEMPFAFLIAFVIIGSTDFFDGMLARRLNQVTKLGKVLDTVADIMFYISTAWFFYRLYPHYLEPNFGLLVAFFVVYFFSFIVSTVYLGKPIMMHTSLLRFCAVLVYVLVILSYLFNTTYFLSFILILFMIGFFEAIMIFMAFGAVDVDTKTIFSLIKKYKKQP
jgi:cardiolipin synthase (CMP-forming)